MLKKYLLIEAAILCGCFSSATAQDIISIPNPAPKEATTKSAQSKVSTIRAGVVNGKAKNLVMPIYPAAAKAARARGTVSVQVLIDEDGNIISADAVSGHPLLRAAAVLAARESTFTPTTLSGRPVKVSGVINYNFVEPPPNFEKETRIFKLGTFLFVMRSLAADYKKFVKDFGMPDNFSEFVAENPEFAKELEPLGKFSSLTADKRIELIDQIVSAVKAKDNGRNDWQMRLGEHFGGIMTQFVIFSNQSEDEFDINLLNRDEIKLNLAKIKDLLYAAPPEFPVAVLEKLKKFSDLNNGNELDQTEDIARFVESFGAVIETISPGVMK